MNPQTEDEFEQEVTEKTEEIGTKRAALGHHSSGEPVSYSNSLLLLVQPSFFDMRAGENPVSVIGG
jgi:hypothetical protein